MSYDKHATSSSAWRYRHIPVNRATGTGRRGKSRSPQQTSMRWSSASTPGFLKKRPACGCIPPEMLQSHVESYSRHGPEVFHHPQLTTSDSAQGHCGVRLAVDIKMEVFGYAVHPHRHAHRRLFGRPCSASRSNSSCFRHKRKCIFS